MPAGFPLLPAALDPWPLNHSGFVIPHPPQARALVGTLVLFTDMARHHDLMARLRAAFEVGRHA
jgi:hypothetical protein